MALQISSQSAKMGLPHRLSGLSDVRDIQSAQETLHRLGVPRSKPSFTDICLATDPSSEEKVWEDDTGKYKMMAVENPAWNRRDLNQKRLMTEVGGEWVDWKGRGVSSRAECARANVDLIMKVDGRVCYMNLNEMNVRLAYFKRKPGMNEKKQPEILISKRLIPGFLKELSL